jgi:hypothetical protein
VFNLLKVLIKGKDIVNTSTEFLDLFPSPPSSDPVGTFHPNEDDISAAKDEGQDLTGSIISALLSSSTIGKRDRAQKTALENESGRIEGLLSTKTSTHNIGMHIHSRHS